MKAPTAPGRKLADETLTWLNQGQTNGICTNLPNFITGEFC